MTPDEMVGEALAVAAEGLAAGEHPIGAVVVLGDEVLGRAYTGEKGLGRRLVHADLLAMTDADHRLGWRRREHPLRMAVTLEPCLMCLGAAMVLGVREIYYALESPVDGAAEIARQRKQRFGSVPGGGDAEIARQREQRLGSAPGGGDAEIARQREQRFGSVPGGGDAEPASGRGGRPGAGGAAPDAQPELEPSWFATPAMFGGVRREESRALYRLWCESAPPGPMRDWARALIKDHADRLA